MTEIHCRLCQSLAPVKNRRLIFSPSFSVLGQLEEVVCSSVTELDGQSGYVCYQCFNKLARLSKLTQDRENILKELKHTFTCTNTQASSKYVSTPKKATPTTPRLKRVRVIGTPTPRKSKRAMTTTPTKTSRKQLLPNQVKVLTKYVK